MDFVTIQDLYSWNPVPAVLLSEAIQLERPLKMLLQSACNFLLFRVSYSN